MITVPEELAALPQWVLWRRETRNGTETKVPYRADGKGRARSNDCATWAPLANAMHALANGADGIGFVLATGGDLVGIDVDVPVEDPIAVEIIERFRATYCERSPNGKLHVWCKGKPQRCGKGTIDKRVEVYDRTRYLTVTGDHIEGTADEVTEQQAALDWLHGMYFAKAERHADEEAGSRSGEAADELSDDEIIDRAGRAKNGGKFTRLMDGDWAGYASHSEADSALCCILAFWTRNPNQIDRIFRRSKLYRAKWDERHAASGHTYGAMTIRRALETVRNSGRSRRPPTMNRKTRKTPQIPTRTRPRSARDVPPSAATVKAKPYAASKSGGPACWAPKRSFVARSFGTRSTIRGASTRWERASSPSSSPTSQPSTIPTPCWRCRTTRRA